MQDARDKIKPERARKESLDRLTNQLYQAQASGDSSLAKKIKLIIDRLKTK